MTRRTISEQAGRIDPVISMGQRAYDLFARLWPQLATVATGGVMSGLAYVTHTVRAYGPIVIGGVGIFSAILAWAAFATIQFLRTKRARIAAETSAIRKWNSDVSGINPLDDEFRKQRILISDLSHPITQQISNKRFADCELVGPANILLHSGAVGSTSFNNCDLVAIRDGALMQNATVFINVDIYRCAFWKCTIYLPQASLQQFADINGNFVSLTGNAQIDSKPINVPPGATRL